MKREEERRPYNSVHETRGGARFRGIVRGMDPLEGESWSSVVDSGGKKGRPAGRRGRGDIARRRLQCCNDVRAHPGRRLTWLTFGQPRNIDARYRSPLHFLELWSITAVLSRLAWVHDYRPLAAADRDNLLTVYLLRKRSNSGPPLSQVFHFLCIRIEYFLSSFLLERIIWFRSTN